VLKGQRCSAHGNMLTGGTMKLISLINHPVGEIADNEK